MFSRWLKTRFAIVFVTMPIVMAFVGPFGTYTDMGFWNRLLYWTVLTFGVGALMIGCIAYVLRFPTERMSGMIPRIVTGAAVAALPGAVLVMAMHAAMRDGSFDFAPARFVQLWLQVTFVGIVVSFVELARAGVYRPKPKQHLSETKPAVAKARKPEIAQEPAPKNGSSSTLVSLSMQDHYVEFTTTQGKELILMRFTDALDQLDDEQGLRIHRSHWVAKNHVKDLRRSGHRAWVTLTDGRELPVSQTYLKDVQAVLKESVSAL